MKKSSLVLMTMLLVMTGCSGNSFKFELYSDLIRPADLVDYGFETKLVEGGVKYTYNMDLETAECISGANLCAIFATDLDDEGSSGVAIAFKSDNFKFSSSSFSPERNYMAYGGLLNNDGGYDEYTCETPLPSFENGDENIFTDYDNVDIKDVDEDGDGVSSNCYDFFNFWDFDQALADGYFTSEDMIAFNASMSLAYNLSGVEVRPMSEEDKILTPGYYDGANLIELYKGEQ